MTNPYGAWKSPITAGMVASAGARFGDVQIDGEDLYWIESRPDQGGRNTIMRYIPGSGVAEILPQPWNARSTAHEYGGGAMLAHGGIIYFSHFGDQQIYRFAPGKSPEAVTNEKNMRYADFIMDRRRKRLIMAREDHSQPGKEPANALAALPLIGGGKTEILVSGKDFYSSPRLSPDGSQLAWLAWNHPNMPWDATELWVADIRQDGSLENHRKIAGGADESVFQPEWSPQGVLYFVSDRAAPTGSAQAGWWNLYKLQNGRVEPLLEMDAAAPPAEFGFPQWVFGMSAYGFESEECLICGYTRGGIWYLARLDVAGRKLEALAVPCSAISQVRAGSGKAVVSGASPTQIPSLVEINLQTGNHRVLRRSGELTIGPGYFSLPEAITFDTGGGQKAHGFFYPPRNQDFTAPEGAAPPLIVMIHGGPTAAADTGLKLKIQYWTSRGFAALNVNYRGSSGYGRAYRELLNGQWGVADVEDCVYGAKYLAERGRVDATRMIITGGSAGGFTALAALTFHDVFSAGSIYYGISDLEALARDTHKFESRYTDRLIAPYPEKREIYAQRSPIHFIDRLARPVIFFQGMDDKVVPPNQSERMVQALRKKKIPVAYLTFQGEGHGFRRSENLRRALEAEYYFYARVFGFEIPDKIDAIAIENL